MSSNDDAAGCGCLLVVGVIAAAVYFVLWLVGKFVAWITSVNPFSIALFFCIPLCLLCIVPLIKHIIIKLALKNFESSAKMLEENLCRLDDIYSMNKYADKSTMDVSLGKSLYKYIRAVGRVEKLDSFKYTDTDVAVMCLDIYNRWFAMSESMQQKITIFDVTSDYDDFMLDELERGRLDKNSPLYQLLADTADIRGMSQGDVNYGISNIEQGGRALEGFRKNVYPEFKRKLSAQRGSMLVGSINTNRRLAIFGSLSVASLILCGFVNMQRIDYAKAHDEPANVVEIEQVEKTESYSDYTEQDVSELKGKLLSALENALYAALNNHRTSDPSDPVSSSFEYMLNRCSYQASTCIKEWYKRHEGAIDDYETNLLTRINIVLAPLIDDPLELHIERSKWFKKFDDYFFGLFNDNNFQKLLPDSYVKLREFIDDRQFDNKTKDLVLRYWFMHFLAAEARYGIIWSSEEIWSKYKQKPQLFVREPYSPGPWSQFRTDEMLYKPPAKNTSKASKQSNKSPKKSNGSAGPGGNKKPSDKKDIKILL